MRATLFVRNKMRKPIVKKGDKYNRLTAVQFDHRRGSTQYWLFKCECGNKKVLQVNNVKSGNTKSCGCLKKGRIAIHGMSYSREHITWASMKARCCNKNAPDYKNYGGRGIKVCDRWKNSFKNFYKDMGKRPKGMTLDRIDNEKGYYKENCRWATNKEQQNNKRSNHLLTYAGKTLTITQWENETGIKRNTLYARINRCGWSIDKALKN